MNDLFQLTSIVSGAIRDCAAASGEDSDRAPLSVEESNCIAKAILSALSDAGFEIVTAAQK